MSFDENYIPTGPNVKSNDYYKKFNHVRIPKSLSTKAEFLGPSASFDVNILGLTDNPTYGLSAEIGSPLTLTTTPPVAVVGQRWIIGSTTVSTDPVFIPTEPDDNGRLYAEVDTVDETGRSATYIVRQVPPVYNTAPTISTVPANIEGIDFPIPGVRQIAGDTLSLDSNGSVTGSGISFRSIWQRNGNDIGGSQGTGAPDLYQTQYPVDDGADMTCKVTAENSGGAVSLPSNIISLTPYEPARLITRPTILGEPVEGGRVTATSGDKTGVPFPEDDYFTWFINGVQQGPSSQDPSFDIPKDTDGLNLVVLQEISNLTGSDSLPSNPVVITPSGTIISLAAGTQDAPGGNIDITFEIDIDLDAWWIWSTSATQPTPEQIQNGQDHTGSPAPDSGQSSMTKGDETGNIVGLSDTLDGSYWLHMMPEGSDIVTTATGGPVAIAPGPTEEIVINETFDYPDGSYLRAQPDWSVSFGGQSMWVWENFVELELGSSSEGLEHVADITADQLRIEAEIRWGNVGESGRLIAFNFDREPTVGMEIQFLSNGDIILWGPEGGPWTGNYTPQAGVFEPVRVEYSRLTQTCQVFVNDVLELDADISGEIPNPQGDTFRFYMTAVGGGWQNRVNLIRVTRL